MITGLEEAEAKRLIRFNRCGEPACNGRLSFAWGGHYGFNEWVVRCGKDPTHKTTTPDIDMEGVKMTNASSTTLVSYDTPLGPVELSVEAIRTYLSPKATAQEAYIFLQKCRFQQLNPFMGEVYLVIYEQTKDSARSAQMIIGKEAHTRRAERHPDYQGMEAGVVLLHDGATAQVPGAFMEPGDKLLGGWCKVHRKGKEPFFISVTLKEYDTGRRQWQKMPATMIRKVAVVQALREAFPSEMAGLQGGDEFSLAEEQAQIIEGQLAQQPRELDDLVPPGSRLAAELERDLDDLFPRDNTTEPEEPPPPNYERFPDEPFDPETAPPPALPAHVTAMTHFEAVLQERGWDVARLQSEVLGMPLATYLHSHTLDQVYQAFRAHVAKG